MKLEVGKRYVLRNGEVVGPLSDYGGGDFRFTARNNSGQRLSWRIDGSERLGGGESYEDIVSEYSEPQPEPLRWVDNCKPDKPGIWAQNDYGILFAAAWYEKCIERAAKWPNGTYCYLGPIPEILPPKKKVVQRLWVKPVSDSAPNTGSLYEADWIADGEATEPNWIRTDETREVEQ